MLSTRTVFCALLLVAPSLSFGQFDPNDDVELLRDEPLLFSNTVFRQGKNGEWFRVAAYRPDTHKVFLLAKDEKGKTIAVNVPDTAVVLVKKDLITLNERAFTALREGRLDEAQKLLIQAAALDSERSICREIAAQLGRITTAQLAYQQEFKKMPQIQAEIQRRLRNASVLESATVPDANDKSNQARAEQGRKDAELLGVNAKAFIKMQAQKVGGAT